MKASTLLMQAVEAEEFQSAPMPNCLASIADVTPTVPSTLFELALYTTADL